MIPRLTCGALTAMALTACSSLAVLNSTHEDELQKLHAGQPRSEVQRRLGTPGAQRPLANGWREDQHELRLRDDDSSTYAIVDVLALGTLSMGESLSGRPRDPIYRVSVLYDQDDKLVCARALRLSRENHAFKHLLPADSIVGRCPAVVGGALR
jgi:hypothetical protein